MDRISLNQEFGLRNTAVSGDSDFDQRPLDLHSLSSESLYDASATYADDNNGLTNLDLFRMFERQKQNQNNSEQQINTIELINNSKEELTLDQFHNNVCIIGTGKYAQALTKIFFRAGFNVNCWGRNESKADSLNEEFERQYHVQNKNVEQNLPHATSNIHEAIKASGIIVLAIPAYEYGNLGWLRQLDLDPNTIIVSASKGFVITNFDIQNNISCLRTGNFPESIGAHFPLSFIKNMSQYLKNLDLIEFGEEKRDYSFWDDLPAVMISGPGYADGIITGSGCTLTVASRDEYSRKLISLKLRQTSCSPDQGPVLIQCQSGTQYIQAGGICKNIGAFARGIVEGVMNRKLAHLDPRELEQQKLNNNTIIDVAFNQELAWVARTLDSNAKHSQALITGSALADYNLSSRGDGRNISLGRMIGENPDLKIDDAIALMKKERSDASTEGPVSAWMLKNLLGNNNDHNNSTFLPLTQAVVEVLKGTTRVDDFLNRVWYFASNGLDCYDRIKESGSDTPYPSVAQALAIK